MHPSDILTPLDIRVRDLFVRHGLKGCQALRDRSTEPKDRMFYMGSLQGFESCKGYTVLGDFTGKCEELQYEERRESAKEIVEPERRAWYGLDAKETCNENRVWFLRGEMQQIRYVYDRIMEQRRSSAEPIPPPLPRLRLVR